MFGFGPMSSFFHDESLENDGDFYNPVEPFSRDEFTTYNDRELRNLDAGRDSDYDECPECGEELHIRDGAEYVRCRECGGRFRVDDL